MPEKRLKVLTILGTRPEFIKLSRVIPALDATTDHVLLHSGAAGQSRYAAAIAGARAALAAPECRPSARALDAIRRDFEGSYTRFIRAQSAAARRDLLARPYPVDVHVRFEAMARESIDAQHRIEAADTLPFEDYLRHYLAPERLQP